MQVQPRKIPWKVARLARESGGEDHPSAPRKKPWEGGEVLLGWCLEHYEDIGKALGSSGEQALHPTQKTALRCRAWGLAVLQRGWSRALSNHRSAECLASKHKSQEQNENTSLEKCSDFTVNAHSNTRGRKSRKT